MKNLIALIPLLPLAGFLINGLGRKYLAKGLVGLVGSGTVLGSFIISCMLFAKGEFSQTPYTYFNFFTVGNLRVPFAFQIDQLSSLFLLIITGVGFLIHVYSTSYMHEEKREHFARYFAFLNLFVFSMLLLVMGANYLIMFIGWEGVGLCSYLLIGYWFKNIDYTKAAKKAFVMNRIGDLGFLLALFWILERFGSLNYIDLFGAKGAVAAIDPAGPVSNSKAIVGITLLLFLGATGKSAQIPLYTWLPDAMAGPTPVSALIHAATMVTAGIYMIARSNLLYNLAPGTLNVVAVTGAATALLAATIALRQNDIKKVLAYSTVSQLGYMFLALGTGAYVAAVFHVMTHAFFKALLFLGSGSVIHAMSGQQDIRYMGGLKGTLKITYITFFIGCLAIAGIPPFSGFFSKDAILLSAFHENKFLYAVGLLTAALTAFYMFRLLFITFNGSFRGTEEERRHLHESPAAMTIPLIVLAILSVVGGFVGVPEIFMHGGEKLSEFLAPVVHTKHVDVDHGTEWILVGLTTAVAIAAILFAWSRYRNYREERSGAFGKVLENKWYVDELYDSVFVKPLNGLSRVSANLFERSGIDAIVNGVGKAVNYGGRQMRWLQSGQVGSYVLLMVVSMVLFFVLEFFLKK
ncbi:NADH-quinone oxidoreductase subunit L [Flaviaesturariibacter flavus]|uniref:NADH-quinone oxidoreductase subunit L n=1 Tax=Flaviaesturariibacter flavus TaxID=2502780 RepID=A0A4R1BBL8_9BACT|nr:NADH-quinone oxidoreductase subunit L [Flaviaesturariibacter flavus]TCJ14415.1 NADH-quinone oxidoreductase subunit L [Flaviaesturariibacter flavus]